MQKYELIERSIIKKYKKEIWHKFIAAVKEYQLIQRNDRIAVCISGGKDSMLLAKCIQQLQRHSDFPFEAVYLVMDPGYAPANRRLIEENAQLLNLPVHIFESNIFHVVDNTDRSPCYLCAKMRRGYLYSKAQELGCNKIALGHHFDDVVETILMSMLYGSEMRTMMPKLHSTNFTGMELIRPLYMVKEADILAWKRYNELQFIQCACSFTEREAQAESVMGSKRQEMKQLIKEFRRINPNIDMNIFVSAHNVNLDAVIGYRKGGDKHSFLENYDMIAALPDEE
ncbi:tRNA 2-thiocytidine biosynthesis TtcA family protein [Acetanaerobacterium elongatum]|uniref:tRNA(Ile)-lysidine synthase TilS/MesJ n=1 Tax=Acetanaerobacterium elongatum TaxID=258515 RepID=A0A1H0AG65_9FIRM|nr:ATP-binding protein [Acetanaerobacterium elongatum]SDN32612.1 tRNA(Ile)-lysidine synthase TilS/MesJ [Acetanaerobacterium elongatum]